MSKTLFISHSTYDTPVVKILADLITKVSLEQIFVWYSNDTNTNGGFLPGDNWYETILSNLKNSTAVISFITPNSNNQPWVLYESGYADALESSKLMPLRFMINIDEISTPLRQKHIFSFSTVSDVCIFLDKVLNKFDIKFDKEVFLEIIKESIDNMKNEYNLNEKNTKKDDPLNSLSKKIDNYFEKIIELSLQNEPTSSMKYEVPILYSTITGNTLTEYIEINPTLKISNILDSIYFLLNERIEPYKYMETWILKQQDSHRYLVVSDVQDIIPATTIFKPNTQWEIVFLDKPYTPDNSFNKRNNRVDSQSYMYLKP